MVASCEAVLLCLLAFQNVARDYVLPPKVIVNPVVCELTMQMHLHLYSVWSHWWSETQSILSAFTPLHSCGKALSDCSLIAAVYIY